jgi:hypothetical protein
MCIGSPFDSPLSNFTYSLDILDEILTCIFIVEIILKIIAFGLFFNGPNSFFRKLENILGYSFFFFLIIFI